MAFFLNFIKNVILFDYKGPYVACIVIIQFKINAVNVFSFYTLMDGE